MITRAEILMGRDAEYPLDAEKEANLSALLVAANKLRAKYGKPMLVSSGYRPGKYNEAAGGAKNSAHVTCEAIDFKDADGAVKKFCTSEVLEECGLYMEHPDATPSWCHVTTRAPKSGKRIFRP